MNKLAKKYGELFLSSEKTWYYARARISIHIFLQFLSQSDATIHPPAESEWPVP